MNSDSRKALFAETHKSIDDAADSVASSIGEASEPSLSYPPGVELSAEEKRILSGISLTPEEISVLKKLVVDACSYPMFHTLSILDGVTEPYVIEAPDWEGGSLEASEEGSMLHDEFLDTYWDYDQIKKS